MSNDRSMAAKLSLSILLLVVAFGAKAGIYNPNTLPFDLDEVTFSRIINPDNIFDQSSINQLDTLLLQLEHSTQVQAFVIIVEHIENDDPFTFTVELANKYGIGGKANRGLVLTIATEDRSYALLPGDGVEGALSDVICSNIRNKVLVPLLKESKWADASYMTMHACKEILEGDEEMIAKFSKEEDDDDLAWLLVLVSLFGAPIALAIYANKKEKEKTKCKECEKYSMKLTNTDKEYNGDGSTTVIETWTCSNCGHVETKKRISRRDSLNDNNRGPRPPFGVGGGRSYTPRVGPFTRVGGGHFSGGGVSGRF